METFTQRRPQLKTRWRSLIAGVLLAFGLVFVLYTKGFFTIPEGGTSELPELHALCSVGGLDSSCVFTNTGNAADSACVRVTIVNTGARDSVESATLCSGLVQSQDTVKKPVNFLGERPFDLCDRWDDCDLQIRWVN